MTSSCSVTLYGTNIINTWKYHKILVHVVTVNCIISIKAHGASQRQISQVINKNQEKDWTQNGSLWNASYQRSQVAAKPIRGLSRFAVKPFHIYLKPTLSSFRDMNLNGQLHRMTKRRRILSFFCAASFSPTFLNCLNNTKYKINCLTNAIRKDLVHFVYFIFHSFIIIFQFYKNQQKQTIVL